MKKIGISIIIFIVIIILLLLLLKNSENIKFTTKNTSRANNTEIQQNDGTNNKIEPTPATDLPNMQYISNNNIKEISLDTQYFNIKNIIDKYFYECDNLIVKDSDVLLPRIGLNETELKKYIEDYKKDHQDLAKDVIYNMLAKEYIDEFKITKENIADKIGIDYGYKTIISSIKVSEQSDRINLYFISGMTINIPNKTKSDFKLLISTDATNRTYQIYPEEYLKKHNMYNLKDGDTLKMDIGEIKEEKNNTYEIKEFSDVDICQQYYDSLVNMILYVPDEAYKLLDTDYLKKRFNNKEEYNKYINDNREIVYLSKLSKYKVIEENNQIIYICIDNFNNNYIFKRKAGILDYTLMLDDYTIMSSADIAEYSTLSEEEIAGRNIRKFIKMINTKNYNAIYSILNETFKNNNFKSVNDLENYIKNNFYEVNGIELIDIKELDNLFAYEYKIFNKRNTQESKTISIITNKTKDTNFTISFSFK